MKNYGAGIKGILVVEDEPAISQVCQRVLGSEGFEVDIVVNGSLAQGMLRENHCDLAFIDIRTPVMNGKQVYQWMKEENLKLANSVIFTTGDVWGGDTQVFLEQVGRPFLPKPFSPDEFRAVVRKTLGQIEK